jgi:hypothetical protein
VLYRIKDRLRRAHFRHECRGILDLPPIAIDSSSSAIVFSQLPHKDLLMFLVALHSFARFVPIKGVHLLNDGSVTAEDRALLHAYIPGLVFYELTDFRSPACPKGGTWERLLGIAELVQDHYVIQLDSDTLAISAIDEVVKHIRNDTAFALGTWDCQEFETMAERADQAKKIISEQDNSHIQVLAEANLDRLYGYESLRYVRGCSGFAGFAARSFSREGVEALSRQMYAALGSKWNTWGSEQFTSNVIVANSPSAVVLPHPKYCACNRVQAVTAFIHFIGSCRFNGGIYARMAKRIIGELKGRG